MTASDYLRRHDLPADALQRVGQGTVNQVWRTAEHVLRVGAAGDHAREARLALGALELDHARRLAAELLGRAEAPSAEWS